MIAVANAPVDQHKWARMVRRTKGFSQAAKSLASALVSDFYNRQTGQLNPGVEAMAFAMGASRSTAKRARDELVQYGFLIVDQARGRGRTNGYRLAVPGEIRTQNRKRKRLNRGPETNGSNLIKKQFSGGPTNRTTKEPKNATDRAETSGHINQQAYAGSIIRVSATADVVQKWSSWLEAHGEEAESLNALIRDGLVKIPTVLPPPLGSHTEKSVLAWFQQHSRGHLAQDQIRNE